MIQKLEENDTPLYISNDRNNNKREISVSVTEKEYNKELEPVQHN